MTYQEFLSALRTTPRDWEIRDLGDNFQMIRRGPESQCPISSLCNLPAWRKASLKLKLDATTRRQIADAADITTLFPKIRKDLLEACGLEEK